MSARRVRGSSARSGWIAPALFLLLLGAAIADAVLTVAGVLAPLDRTATVFLYRFEPGWLVPAMVGLTLLGDDPPLDVFAVAIAVWAFRAGHRRAALAMVCVALTARVVGAALKAIVQRPRPFLHAPPHPLAVLHGYGYPSGHALLSMAILGFGAAVLLELIAARPVAILLALVSALLILGIGWSRVFLGFHWLNDVLGGYLDGAVIALAGRLAEVGVLPWRVRPR